MNIDPIRRKINDTKDPLNHDEAQTLLDAYDEIRTQLEAFELVPRSEFQDAVEACAETVFQENDEDDIDINTAIDVCSESNFILHTNRHLAAILYGDRHACAEHDIDVNAGSGGALETLALYAMASVVLSRAQEMFEEHREEEEEDDSVDGDDEELEEEE